MNVKELIKALMALPGDAPVTLLVSEDIGREANIRGDIGSVVVVRDTDGEVVSVTLSEDEAA